MGEGRGPTGLPGLEVRQLRAFATLVDRGGITAAARELGVAQSTVSEALSALERVLGAPVAVRRPGARRIELTPAGKALLPHARAVLAALGEAQAAVAAATRRMRGRVEVVANESVSTYLLPAALGPLRRRWPNTRFAVSVAACAGVREGVARNRFDVGLLLGAEGPESQASAADAGMPAEAGPRPLAPVRILLFSRPGHPAVPRGRASSVARVRLAAYPIFVSDASGDFQTLLSDFFAGDGLPGPRLQPTGSIEAVKRSVSSDPLALGVLPEYTLADELRTGQVEVVPVRPGLPRVRLEARLPPARPTHPAVVEIIDSICAALVRSPSEGPAARRPGPREA